MLVVFLSFFLEKEKHPWLPIKGYVVCFLYLCLLPAVDKGFVSHDELLKLFDTGGSAFGCKKYSYVT